MLIESCELCACSIRGTTDTIDIYENLLNIRVFSNSFVCFLTLMIYKDHYISHDMLSLKSIDGFYNTI